MAENYTIVPPPQSQIMTPVFLWQISTSDLLSGGHHILIPLGDYPIYRWLT